MGMHLHTKEAHDFNSGDAGRMPAFSRRRDHYFTITCI